MPSSTAATTTGFTRLYPGQPEQVGRARHDVARYLNGHSRTDDVILIVSELASNACLHSRSKGETFTLSVEVHRGYIHLECEDAGGFWAFRPADPELPHGLDIIEALVGADNWDVDGSLTSHAVWVRVETA